MYQLLCSVNTFISTIPWNVSRQMLSKNTLPLLELTVFPLANNESSIVLCTGGPSANKSTYNSTHCQPAEFCVNAVSSPVHISSAPDVKQIIGT